MQKKGIKKKRVSCRERTESSLYCTTPVAMAKLFSKVTRVVATALVLLGLLVLIQFINNDYQLNHEESTSGLHKTSQKLDKKELFHTTAQRQLKETGKATKNAIKSYPEQLGTPPIDLELKGYVILETLGNSGGSTDLLQDLLTLQCWASVNHLELVQPSLDTSDETLKTDLLRNYDNLLPLDKAGLYDMNQWNTVFTHTSTSTVNINPMVTLQDAADTIYHASTVIVVDMTTVLPSTEGHLTRSGRCMKDSYEYGHQLLEKTGLTVTSELCFDNHPTTKLSDMLTETSKEISRRTAVINENERLIVIIRNWPSERDRAQLTQLSKHLQCGISDSYKTLIRKTNQNIERKATQYIQSMYKNDSFMAIVLTSEILESESLSRCLEQVIMKFHKLKANHSKMKVFIALSEYNREDGITRLIPFKMFFRAIHWTSYSIDQWREDLDKYTKDTSTIRQDTRLVLENIASRAACLVLAGHGQFSENIQTKYRNAHDKGSGYSSCVITVKECNRSN